MAEGRTAALIYMTAFLAWNTCLQVTLNALS